MAQASWKGWADFCMNVVPRPEAAIVYNPADGSVWGAVGTIPFDGCHTLNQLDKKADGEQISIRLKSHEKAVMFLKKTDEDSPLSVFRCGCHSIVTMKGPTISRIAVYIEGKHEPYLAALETAKRASPNPTF